MNPMLELLVLLAACVGTGWLLAEGFQLGKYLQPRYSIWTSTDGLNWCRRTQRWNYADSVAYAVYLRQSLPFCHVEVTDSWRDHRMVHFLSADLNDLASYHKLRKEYATSRKHRPSGTPPASN